MPDTDLREMAERQYRETFECRAGAYVLADLRARCRVRPEQIDPEVMDAELRTDPERYREHMALIRLWRHIRRYLPDEIDERIDAAEEHVRSLEDEGEMHGR